MEIDKSRISTVIVGRNTVYLNVDGKPSDIDGVSEVLGVPSKTVEEFLFPQGKGKNAADKRLCVHETWTIAQIRLMSLMGYAGAYHREKAALLA